MSKFNAALRAHFGARFGAFSAVTDREATGDKSVTVDRDEKSVLFSRYDRNGFERGRGDTPNAYRRFNVWNPYLRSYVGKRLAIKHPKKDGTELRLYFNRDSGFYPEVDNIWFIFLIDEIDEPFIGTMNRNRWDDLSSGDRRGQSYVAACDLDDEDEEYQRAIQSPSVYLFGEEDAPRVREVHAKYNVTRHKRSAVLAAQEIKRAAHTCQVDGLHKTFTAGSTGADYVEVHHLIPMAASASFKHSLDVPANLVVLCPLCHRAIHYGDANTIRNLLDKLFVERNIRLEHSGIKTTKAELYMFYGVAEEDHEAA
jgi:5-methylcytosine-specific restriction protein A